MIPIASLLAAGLYAYGLCVLLAARQELPLLGACACGMLAFALAAFAAFRRGRRLSAVLLGMVVVVSAGMLVLLLLM